MTVPEFSLFHPGIEVLPKFRKVSITSSRLSRRVIPKLRPVISILSSLLLLP